MSVDIYVEAQRKVSEIDLEYLRVYNSLISMDIIPPVEVIEYLREALGGDNRLGYGEAILILPADGMVATRVRGEGDAKYGEGMIIEIADLPPGTKALRIYMS